MLRGLLSFSLIFLSIISEAQTDTASRIASYFNINRLKSTLIHLASDELEGRETGERGQREAAGFIAGNLAKAGMLPGGDSGTYFQNFNAKFRSNKVVATENVVAYLPGTDLAHEVVILSAHYDHLGVRDDKIYFGADDNGSGSSAIIELAYALGEAARKGYKPRRTILFLFMSGEEKGLLGSEFYVHKPRFALDSCIADLNIDMIGRIDSAHLRDSNYVYVIGSDMLSTDLHRINEAANQRCCGLKLDYTYNSPDDPNRYYYRSDHYNFARNRIPVVFYFNGVHADYHKPSDSYDKISYDILLLRSRLVLFTLWELANREKRPVVDK